MSPDESPVSDWNERVRPVLISLAEALISSRLRGDLEASDLVQQTLLEAHEDRELLAQLDAARQEAWLRRALKNNLIDAVRHLHTQKQDVGRRCLISQLEESFQGLDQWFMAEDTSPSQAYMRHEEVTRMLCYLQNLSDNQRRALQLKHLQGSSLTEVATALGVSESAAAGLLHRGRKKLYELMRESPDD